jgi:hypothetical protein
MSERRVRKTGDAIATRGQARARGLAVALLAAVLPGLLGAAAPAVAAKPPPDNVVLRWNAAALEGVRQSALGPPMVSRALAIVHTCVYDAWAAYSERAVGTRLGGSLRRPPAERKLANKNKAISFAAYRAAVDLLPASQATVFDPLMASLGYDPSDTTTDTSTPAGVGNVACAAVLEFRHQDGANQLGDMPGGTPGVPYSDYTGYAPSNEVMDLTHPFAEGTFDSKTVLDCNRWQPLRYPNASGTVVTPGFIGPYWNRVAPFALASGNQFRSPTGPARFGTQAFVDQARELLDISANLDDRQKAIAEYWADGPSSELPPGHWDLFAQVVSRRDGHGVDQDAQLFFALTNAIFDAGIVAWDNKIAFDSVRPITAVRYIFEGKRVRAWAGPGRGTRYIDGGDWHPYQPSSFPTPPFAEYSSGHSSFSAAGAEILRRFTGSDVFGHSETIAAGSSKVEPGTAPASSVTLSWSTFTEAANEAGISRRYGGIHFTQGDLDARESGRLAGAQAWAKAQTYFQGTSP